MKKELKITGLHGLKSARDYDFSSSRANTTHQQIDFTFYEDDEVSKSYRVIISIEVLWDVLKPFARERNW